MTDLDDNIIRYIKVDEKNGGFNYVMSAEYDTQFSVMNTNNPNF